MSKPLHEFTVKAVLLLDRPFQSQSIIHLNSKYEIELFCSELELERGYSLVVLRQLKLPQAVESIPKLGKLRLFEKPRLVLT
jgi:hypothetical protein